MLAALGGCDSRADEPHYDAPAMAQTGDRLFFHAGTGPSFDAGNGQKRQVKSLLNISRPMKYGDFVWNDKNVPAGSAWVLVDLRRQTMSVFRGGAEIGTAVTLYGVDDRPTPTGRFTVLARAKDHRSSVYDAPMPYTLRLTNDGVSIHGSDVREGLGTHGCLGIPLEFARRVFDQISRGDDVFILPDTAGHGDAPSPSQHVS
ncbi:L,D-transpeptidase family protein [Sphingomonas ginkgonis]|uniref:L,D-transpeptidase family protein n=1 Tax=Sphingomonas ginkgonis TaxID=2315330 RepID=UPI001EF0103B|nr:L,D-transpeptidase family protein [Sphingomonas ginkgonis]